MRILNQMLTKLYNRQEDSLGVLEHRLHSVLDPVSPNPDFVINLRHQLLSQWGTIPALPTSNTPILILIVLALVFSGIMFVVVSVRLVLIAASTIALLNKWRSQSRELQEETTRILT